MKENCARGRTADACPEGGLELIQVSADASDPAVAERELRALVEAGNLYPQASQRLLTLTRDGAPPELPPGVVVNPAYEWMLAGPETVDWTGWRATWKKGGGGPGEPMYGLSSIVARCQGDPMTLRTLMTVLLGGLLAVGLPGRGQTPPVPVAVAAAGDLRGVLEELKTGFEASHPQVGIIYGRTFGVEPRLLDAAAARGCG